jgi:hypothetical protein
MPKIIELLKTHIIYFIGIGIIIALGALVLIIMPHASGPDILDPGVDPLIYPNLYNLVFFGLGLDTTVIILTIGIFLLYRWYKGGKTNASLLFWGLGFFVYSLTFVAHIFRGLGFAWAKESSSPGAFFFWRFGMILWAGASLYGILRILTENKKIQIIPPVAAMGIGFIWFGYGLFGVGDIEWTMYGFLFGIWIPITFSISYIFLYYGRKANVTGPKILFLGYLGLTITYMGWAPWHFLDVLYFYFVWYFLFLLSLVPILAGFMMLSKQAGEEK